MKNNHFWSPKKRKKSLPQKVLQSLLVKKNNDKKSLLFTKKVENSPPERVLKSLLVKINEKQSLVVTKKEEKITSGKSFKNTSAKKQ